MRGDQAGRPRRYAEAAPPVRPQPVFVDRTGRRRRLTVLAGVGAGTALLVSLVVIVAGLFTGSPTVVPAWPDSDGARKATSRPQVVQRKTPGAPGTSTVPNPERAIPAATAGAGPTNQVTAAADVAPTGQPGRSDEHRAKPAGRPSKSPGKPN